MRKAGGIIALVAGIFGVLAALVTLGVGGLGAAFEANNAGTVLFLGWGGVVASFLTIVLGAICMGATSRLPGICLIVSAIVGAIVGGTLVAIFMALALIGGILAAVGKGATDVQRQHGVNGTVKALAYLLVLVTCTEFAGEARAEDKSISAFDLATDHKSLIGQRFRVTGCTVIAATLSFVLCSVKSKTGNVGSLTVRPSSDDRDGRRRALDQCAGLTGSKRCEVTITATVAEDFQGQPQLNEAVFNWN